MHETPAQENTPVLKLKQIDLHFHAGIERQPGKSLADYLEHAWQTGRRYLGVTDHVEMYMEPGAESQGYCYPVGMAGLRQFKHELDSLRSQYPGLTCFFAPEFYNNQAAQDQAIYNLDAAPEELVEMADYIICDLGIAEMELEDIPGRTAVIVHLLQRMQRLAGVWAKPVYLAHPFRDVSDRKFTHPGSIDRDILAVLQSSPASMEDDLLNRLFSVNVVEIARAACEYNIPLEVNGGTQYRIRTRFPLAYPAYLQAYIRMAAAGARFVCGSDQHEIDNYQDIQNWTEPFDYLGASVLDMGFYRQISNLSKITS